MTHLSRSDTDGSPDSQFLPVNPSAQTQRYLPTRFWHVPLFSHGNSSHSSMSGQDITSYVTTCLQHYSMNKPRCFTSLILDAVINIAVMQVCLCKIKLFLLNYLKRILIILFLNRSQIIGVVFFHFILSKTFNLNKTSHPLFFCATERA